MYRLKVQREERLGIYGRESCVLSFLPSAPLTVSSCRVYVYATKLLKYVRGEPCE